VARGGADPSQFIHDRAYHSVARRGQDSFDDRAFGDHVHAAKRVHQRRFHLFFSGNPGDIDLRAIHLRLGLSHPRAPGFLWMALKEDGASSEAVSIAVVSLRADYWRALHVCLARRVSNVLGTARTAYSQIHQSSGDHEFLADVSLRNSGHPISLRLRFYDGLFFGAKRLLHLCLPIRWIFRVSRQIVAGQNPGHAGLQSMWPLHRDVHFERHGACGGEAVRNGGRSGLHEMYGLHQRVSERRLVFWFRQTVDPGSQIRRN